MKEIHNIIEPSEQVFSATQVMLLMMQGSVREYWQLVPMMARVMMEWLRDKPKNAVVEQSQVYALLFGTLSTWIPPLRQPLKASVRETRTKISQSIGSIGVEVCVWREGKKRLLELLIRSVPIKKGSIVHQSVQKIACTPKKSRILKQRKLSYQRAKERSPVVPAYGALVAGLIWETPSRTMLCLEASFEYRNVTYDQRVVEGANVEAKSLPKKPMSWEWAKERRREELKHNTDARMTKWRPWLTFRTPVEPRTVCSPTKDRNCTQLENVKVLLLSLENWEVGKAA
jgi:hypothetical protein